MHLAKRIANDGVCRRRMGERCPIGSRDLAAPNSVPPKRTDSLLATGLRELIDREAVALIERLVQQLGRLVMASGETDRGTVQVMVGAVRVREPELSSGSGAVPPSERHVPMIEQCRFVLNSQIFVRRGGPATGENSPRVTSAGGIEEMVNVC